MNIWIFNNYNMLPQHGALNRAYFFGKSLENMGHKPTAFVGSHPHNTDFQLIKGREKYCQSTKCSFPWILVKTCNYEGSRALRVFSMFQYYFNLKKAVKGREKPDAIIGSSAHPLAAVAAIKMSRKYGCKGIAEIRDLWPESIVAYGIASKRNPLIKILYKLEKWIYTNADAVIFTMEGGKDYIVEKGWDKEHGGPVDLAKVHHINNGVDLETFDYNREHYTLDDPLLNDSSTFKVIYTGSIRLTNHVDQIVKAAKLIGQNKEIKILVFGDGDRRNELENEVNLQNLSNIVFMGQVEKKYIPFILSKADLCLTDVCSSELFKYGISPNKLFEYIAAQKPILSCLKCTYDIVEKNHLGKTISGDVPEELAKAIIDFADGKITSTNDYSSVREEYNYQNLTKQLVKVIELV